ncbi:MAG: uracil-DNA glycosylase [Planctomycetes bacterium]|nr:uracil-DNA glycosylase [Planctomycetota bacterium]
MADKPNDTVQSLIRAVRNRIEIEIGFGMNDLPLFEKPERADQPSGAASPEDRLEALAKVEAKAMACTKCPLHETRTNVVFGVGDRNADLMFIGEAPGRDEDAQGEPFVGRAGQLLTKIIEAIDMKREEVYIGNILKCRPPNNRNPLPMEMVMCMPYLRQQIQLIQPKIIVALGGTAVQGLLKTTDGITKLRGTFVDFEGVRLMPTFHPAYLLRNPAGKRKVWEDMQQVRDTLKDMQKEK